MTVHPIFRGVPTALTPPLPEAGLHYPAFGRLRVLAGCYGLIAGFCGPWGCQGTPVFHSQCNAHWLFFIR